MSRTWLALLDGAPDGADAAAAVRDASGAPAGTLAAWRRASKPVRDALRVDERLVDPDGAAAWISLVLPSAGVALPFDDPAVQQARRLVLARWALDGVSTLMRDTTSFVGSIAVARGPAAPERLGDDPFARVLPARLLRVDAGLLGRTPPPVGPVIERYGSASPWPWDRFPP